MFHKSCLYVLFVLLSRVAAAQDLALVARIDTTSTFIAADNLDNTYLITPKDELLKYNPGGKLMWRYSNKAFGKLSFVDATDPLRTLLFYAGQQQIVVLNNNLNEISRYRFADISRQVTLAALANTSGYWYFDQANYELHKLGSNFEDLQQSGNLYQVIGKPVQPDMMAAGEQFVYLHDPRLGILQFDRFGSYLKTVLTEPLEYFQPREGSILFVKEGSLISLNTQAYETRSVRLPAGLQVRQASAGGKLLVLRTDKSVYLYRSE